MSFFAALYAPIHRWRTMRELSSLEKDQTYDSSWDFRNMIAKATEALDRDLRGRAKEIWTEAYARFPDLAMMSEAALDLMLRLGLHADAEALLNRAVKRYPNSVRSLEGLARLAFDRRDWAVAEQSAAVLRKKFPQSLKGYWIGAASLSELGRFEAAEATLARGLRVAPNDLILRVESAKLAERREAWDEALKRWTYVHETIRHPVGTIGLATTLSRLGHYDDADALIASVLHRSGNDLGIWIASAQVAEHKQDWEAAANRWGIVRNRFPLASIGYTGSLKSMQMLARPEEAEAIIKEGTDRVPDDVGLFIEHARMAQRGGDWATAVQRWARVRERFPTCQEAYAGEADALEALHRVAEAAAVRAMSPARPP
jgi:tetratricopeptide (TPR) repeat protein